QLRSNPHWRPYIVLLRRDGQLCCVAACYYHDFPFKFQFSVLTLKRIACRVLQVFGGQFVLSPDECVERCFSMVFEFLEKQKSTFNLVFVENLDARTQMWNYCRRKSNPGGLWQCFLASSKIDTAHQIQLPTTHDGFMASLSYETRRKLRRYTRRLCKEHS